VAAAELARRRVPGFVTGLDDTGTAAEYAALLGRN
jgi:hypothetical protein